MAPPTFMHRCPKVWEHILRFCYIEWMAQREFIHFSFRLIQFIFGHSCDWFSDISIKYPTHSSNEPKTLNNWPHWLTMQTQICDNPSTRSFMVGSTSLSEIFWLSEDKWSHKTFLGMKKTPKKQHQITFVMFSKDVWLGVKSILGPSFAELIPCRVVQFVHADNEHKNETLNWFMLLSVV